MSISLDRWLARQVKTRARPSARAAYIESTSSRYRGDRRASHEGWAIAVESILMKGVMKRQSITDSLYSADKSTQHESCRGMETNDKTARPAV